jgi:hypothetical protein
MNDGGKSNNISDSETRNKRLGVEDIKKRFGEIRILNEFQ